MSPKSCLVAKTREEGRVFRLRGYYNIPDPCNHGSLDYRHKLYVILARVAKISTSYEPAGQVTSADFGNECEVTFSKLDNLTIRDYMGSGDSMSSCA